MNTFFLSQNLYFNSFFQISFSKYFQGMFHQDFNHHTTHLITQPTMTFVIFANRDENGYYFETSQLREKRLKMNAINEDDDEIFHLMDDLISIQKLLHTKCYQHPCLILCDENDSELTDDKMFSSVAGKYHSKSKVKLSNTILGIKFV